MFPVLGVDFLGDGAKTVESVRFTDAADLILDLVRETGIEVMAQSTIAVSPNLGRDLIEVDHIVIHAMGVLHAEMIELMLSISNRVVGTECGLELNDELTPTGHPQGMCVGSSIPSRSGSNHSRAIPFR